jgi:hypothetical protein
MTTTMSGSATIYTFPPRGRFALRDRSEEFAQQFAQDFAREFPAVASLQLPRGVRLASGSGWYHDAAIQESNTDASKA